MQSKEEIIKDYHSLVSHISNNEKKKILHDRTETSFHKILKTMLERMNPNCFVELTHGSREFGKDLVIVNKQGSFITTVAIIVKKSKISGNTLGEVDSLLETIDIIDKVNKDEKHLREIESQIKQAETIDSQLKIDWHKHFTNQIIVYVLGDISLEGRQRLGKQSILPIQVHGILDIVNQFTEYYPEVFINEEYCEYLTDKISEFEHKHFLFNKNLNLSDYYVEPMFKKLNQFMDDNGQLKITKSTKIEFSHLLELVNKKQRAFLIGDIGSGKSGVIIKLTLDYYKKARHDLPLVKEAPTKNKLKIPIYITAEQFLKVTNIEDLLKSIPASLLKSSEIIAIFIDSFDEVTIQERNHIVKLANEIANKLSCALIVTSRNIHILDNQDDQYEQYEIIPFDVKTALNLFKKLYDNEEIINNLRTAFIEMNRQMSLVPLSLHLLIEIVVKDDEMPSSVTELYDRYVDNVLGKWDEVKGIETLFSYYIKKSFLAQLSYYEFFKKDRIHVPVSDFEKFTADYSEAKGFSLDNMQDMISEIQKSGMIKINQSIYFNHRSFLDYFIALYINEDSSDLSGSVDDFIVSQYYDDLWENVAFYYIGHKRKVTSTQLDKIFNFEGNDFHILLNKFSVGRLLQAGWYSDVQIKRNAIINALSYARPLNQIIYDSIETTSKITAFMKNAIVFMLSESSFGSRVLFKPICDIIDNNIVNLDKNNLYQTIMLLFSIHRLIPKARINSYVESIHEVVKSQKLSFFDEDLYLKILLFVSLDDQLKHALEKRIKKLALQTNDSRKFLVNKLSDKKHSRIPRN
jgi:hypothetical protein